SPTRSTAQPSTRRSWFCCAPWPEPSSPSRPRFGGAALRCPVGMLQCIYISRRDRYRAKETDMALNDYATGILSLDDDQRDYLALTLREHAAAYGATGNFSDTLRRELVAHLADEVE